MSEEQKNNSMKIKEVNVESVPDYLQNAIQAIKDWHDDSGDEEIWFRGQSKSSYKLLPSLYRNKCDGPSMYNLFYTGAPLLMEQNVRPRTLWEWYFAAQHYGIPTRLLDWSEDPLVGLFFAIRGDDKDTDDRSSSWAEGEDPPVVWVIDSSVINKALHNDRDVFVPLDGGNFTCRWLPDNLKEETGNEMPIAIHPTWMTRRIQAQTGKFTVHGTKRTPLEDVWTSSVVGEDASKILKIRVTDPARVCEELFAIGYTRARLFPEPANLANHIFRIHKK